MLNTHTHAREHSLHTLLKFEMNLAAGTLSPLNIYFNHVSNYAYNR